VAPGLGKVLNRGFEWQNSVSAICSPPLVFLFMSMGSYYVSKLRSSTGLVFIPQMIMELRVEWYWQGKPKNSVKKKPVPVPLCPPQFPHGLIRAGTLTSAVRGRRITALVMARPRLWSWSSLCRLLYFVRGRAMAQVVSRRPFAVKSWVSSCGICGRQSGTETGFSPPSSDFPCQYHATGAPCSYII
jgi:hypothetical protein